MRIPPSPRNYDYPYGPPPPRWQREDPPYYPPYDTPRDQNYDVPRDQQLPRPYMPPMHGEDPRQGPRMPPPPQDYMERREGPPLPPSPRIHYRPSDFRPPSPKRAKRYPGPPQPEPPTGAGPNITPGALSLLAKVASGGSGDSKQNHRADPEYASPVRRLPPSPHSSPRPIIWTPRDARYGYRGPPQGEWREPHLYHRHDYYPPSSWTYEGPETPPALAERVSFDEGYYSPEGPYPYDYPQPSPPDYRWYPPDARQYISPSSSREMEADTEVYQTAPYTYVQQPRLKGETILRKKFSWKNYPELEQFLIANRDEYLRHSALNYTAEQKQYNNWLTERLMDLAAHHHYVFDPDEFNFVAIRDRIRCYYKSYIQTARKHNQLIKKSHPIKKDTTAQTETSATPSATESHATQTETSAAPFATESHATKTETSAAPSATESHATKTETSATPSATESHATKTETSATPFAAESHATKTETSATPSATTQISSTTPSTTKSDSQHGIGVISV